MSCVPKQAATAEQVAGIWKALDKATDRGRAFLAALGRIIEDAHFIHTWRRARFLRDSLGAEHSKVRRYVESSLPLIGADHPFRPFVEHFGVRYSEIQSAMRNCLQA